MIAVIGLILLDEQDEQDSPQWYDSSIFRLIGLILLDEHDSLHNGIILSTLSMLSPMWDFHPTPPLEQTTPPP